MYRMCSRLPGARSKTRRSWLINRGERLIRSAPARLPCRHIMVAVSTKCGSPTPYTPTRAETGAIVLFDAAAAASILSVFGRRCRRPFELRVNIAQRATHPVFMNRC